MAALSCDGLPAPLREIEKEGCLNVGLGEWRRSKYAAAVQRRSLRIGCNVHETSAAWRHTTRLQRRRRLQHAAPRVVVVRHRKRRVGRDVVERPEVGVVGVDGGVLRVGLPAASLAVLRRSVAGADAEISTSDNVE